MSADIVPGVPCRWVATVNHGGPRSKTLGVFIHSTRGGGSSLETEYQNTVRYCAGANPSQVGPSFVVGPSEVTRMCHDDDTCWCQTVDNAAFLGIEVAQPATQPPFVEFQYVACADICARLSVKYGFPPKYIGRQTTPTVQVAGILGHQDAYSGWSRGKTDPGAKWDWTHFMSLVQAKVRELTEPMDQLPDDIVRYLQAHPELGAARIGPNLTYKDGVGDWVCKTTSGAVVFRRNYTGAIGCIDWLPEPAPFDKGPTRAALTEAEAAIARAKAALG